METFAILKWVTKSIFHTSYAYDCRPGLSGISSNFAGASQFPFYKSSDHNIKSPLYLYETLCVGCHSLVSLYVGRGTDSFCVLCLLLCNPPWKEAVRNGWKLPLITMLTYVTWWAESPANSRWAVNSPCYRWSFTRMYGTSFDQDKIRFFGKEKLKTTWSTARDFGQGFREAFNARSDVRTIFHGRKMGGFPMQILSEQRSAMTVVYFCKVLHHRTPDYYPLCNGDSWSGRKASTPRPGPVGLD